MEDKKTFGAYLLRRRREMGMTQKAFAQLGVVHHQYVLAVAEELALDALHR